MVVRIFVGVRAGGGVGCAMPSEAVASGDGVRNVSALVNCQIQRYHGVTTGCIGQGVDRGVRAFDSICCVICYSLYKGLQEEPFGTDCVG